MIDRGREGGGLVMEATGYLNQESDPVGATLVYAHNGFNKLMLLKMLCTGVHPGRWGEGSCSIDINIWRSCSSTSRGFRHLHY